MAFSPLAGKARIEAFSDGVFAIAITLLVLEIKVPEVEDGGLWAALGGLWPSYLAYAISFLTIGVMWVNHHGLMRRFRAANIKLLYLNILLLATVSFVPFPTSVLAEYMNDGSEADVKASVELYGLAVIGIGISYTLMWGYLVHNTELRDPAVTFRIARIGLRRSIAGLLGYLVATAISFVAPIVSLVILAALAVSFALARLTSGEENASAEEHAT